MIGSTVQSAVALLASEASFVEGTLLYVAGGLLVVLSLVLSFYGMRREDDYPSSQALGVMGGITVVLVVVTAFAAIQNARFEQSERRAENREAAAEEEAVTEENEEAQAPLGEGEDSPEPTGAAGGAEGRTIFLDNGCGGCHTLADAETEGPVGPVLDDVLPGQTPEEIRTSITEPSETLSPGFADGIMPDNYGTVIDPGELDALVDYLASTAGN